MKKTYILSVLLLCLSLVTIQAQKRKRATPTNWTAVRSQIVSNVSYDPTFYIPSSPDEKLTGMAIVSFTMPIKTDVALDFQGQFTGSFVVNDKKRKLRAEGGHLVIPQKYTAQGVNRIAVSFESDNTALHRSNEYLYTRFSEGKASTCFPCFDQQDLQATFTTHLNLPEGWKAISSESNKPISLQLYSFIAGRFEEQTFQNSGHVMRALFRQRDIADAKQLPKIMEESARSLKWMEGYTGVAYPFKECGVLLLTDPEAAEIGNPGIIRLTDRHVFTEGNPSREERLKRNELIARETARLWFGNMVSPREKGDAWGLDLLAAFMAHKMTYQRQREREEYELEFLTTCQARAMSANGSDADKGAVMMRFLEDVAGENLQMAIQKFLLKYYYKPAAWNDFISIVNELVPGENVQQFSDTWVKQAGLPTIFTTYQDGYLIVSQTPPAGTPAFWRQQFEVRLIYDFEKSRTINVNMTQPIVRIKLSSRPSSIIPNYNGRGYGHFTLDNAYTKSLPLRIMVTRDDLNRYALLLTTFDNYLSGRIPAVIHFGELQRSMMKEKNPLIMSTAVDHMMKIAHDRQDQAGRWTLEQCIMDLLTENRRTECQQAIIRKMATSGTAPDVLSYLYDLWQRHDTRTFEAHDYMEMAYHLAIMRPQESQSILSQERQRLASDDLREEFDFVSRACSADAQERRKLASTLTSIQTGRQKLWAEHTLQLLKDR